MTGPGSEAPSPLGEPAWDRAFRRAVVRRSALVIALTSSTALGIVLLARAAEPRDPRETARRSAPHRVPADDTCAIAGSGSNIPLIRRLVEAYGALHPEDRILVHESIGSSGGVRAVADGVVHVGLVSRPLDLAERREGLVAIPHVAVPVVLGAHPTVPDASMSSQALADLVRGDLVRWSDGARAVLLERERGDSSVRVLLDRNPVFRRAQEVAADRTHWHVLRHDTDMVRALAQTPHGVGLADLGVIRLAEPALRVVRLDGLDPLAPDYPYLKELSFVVRGTPRAVAARFVAFAGGAVARALAVAAGYRPLGPGPAR